MQTRISEVPVPALAGGLALIGGIAAWQLGIELERAWLRSFDGPLTGETVEQLSQSAHLGEALAVGGERRRWVARNGLRPVPGPARLA